MKAVRRTCLYILGICIAALCLNTSSFSQSSDQNFPTPVTSNELVGVIKARDIGDARLTTYFFAFDGEQGDIFINVVTKNLSGDIDIFSADGLKPLTKMVVYADADSNETGRLIYLRKPERLLLRIEGRPPGDDPASFRIKFGGSFVALKATNPSDSEKPVTASKKDEKGIRVNSVGTIIEAAPKPALVKTEPEKSKPPVTAPKDVKSIDVKTKEEEAIAVKKTDSSPPPAPKSRPINKPVDSTPKTVFSGPAKPGDSAKSVKPSKKPPARPSKPEETKPDPLANIRLVIQLKDGDVIERRLNEVVKFNVDNGVLTVITKDGKIAHYSMLLVAKVTIE